METMETMASDSSDGEDLNRKLPARQPRTTIRKSPPVPEPNVRFNDRVRDATTHIQPSPLQNDQLQDPRVQQKIANMVNNMVRDQLQ